MRGRHPAVLLLLPWPCASELRVTPGQGCSGNCSQDAADANQESSRTQSSQGGRPQAAARCAVDIPPHGQRQGTSAHCLMPAHERQRGAAPGLPAAYQHSRRGWRHTSRARLQTASGSPAGLLGLAAGLLSLGGRRVVVVVFTNRLCAADCEQTGVSDQPMHRVRPGLVGQGVWPMPQTRSRVC